MARNTTSTRTDAPRSRIHNLILHALRILQLLSAVTSLILFSLRLVKIIRLTRHATHSNGAVEGILAAAVLYTIIATILQLCIRAAGSLVMRILLMIFDILFVGAFIAVAILTSPKRHGSSGPCNTKSAQIIGTYAPSGTNCNLPWGTFILAIVSTILHAITAAYHAARQEHKAKKSSLAADKELHHDTANGNWQGSHNANGV